MHLGTPKTGLETHIQDLANVLEFDDLRDVVLVGHSYGGFVTSSAAARTQDRVRSLAYISASLPRDGDSLFSQADPSYHESVEMQAPGIGGPWRWPLPDFGQIDEYASKHGLDETDQAWFRAKAVGHPIKTISDPTCLDESKISRLPRTYIWCNRDLGEPPPETMGPGWHRLELDSGHWPMITHPGELSEMLLRLA
jgi:pimeloyl-ACP methyl ester carboxylesterase